MKSKVTGKSAPKVKPFPKLMITPHDGIILLMTSEHDGVVVGPRQLGYYSGNWIASTLTDYNGTVELSND